MSGLYPAERAPNIACRLSIYPGDDALATRIADRTSPVAFVAFPARFQQHRRESIYIRISSCVLAFAEEDEEEGNGGKWKEVVGSGKMKRGRKEEAMDAIQGESIALEKVSHRVEHQIRPRHTTTPAS